ncbi:hydrogenase nickel incorporation protein HypB [Candidatus Leptofilum sp.]|uniref:hydrogenase nickel incorporation protein HypB n=1 Tax=Candidatus Leptofilum sp. TaxID=3241576 RepID=UPI003B5A020A
MKQRIPVVENILNANDDLAARNQALLDKKGILGINVLASPGSGKTSVILRTIELLQDRLTIGVIEGDTAAVTIDADKITAVGMPAVQINTGGNCHLDAVQVANGLHQLPLDEIELLIVENVGNLICPASFKLGTHFNIVIASVPEGDDKPYKYPNIYRGIDALILNKMDLLPYIDFDLDYFKAGVEVLNPRAQIFPLSCKTGEGTEAWKNWLLTRLKTKK